LGDEFHRQSLAVHRHFLQLKPMRVTTHLAIDTRDGPFHPCFSLPMRLERFNLFTRSTQIIRVPRKLPMTETPKDARRFSSPPPGQLHRKHIICLPDPFQPSSSVIAMPVFQAIRAHEQRQGSAGQQRCEGETGKIIIPAAAERDSAVRTSGPFGPDRQNHRSVIVRLAGTVDIRHLVVIHFENQAIVAQSRQQFTDTLVTLQMILPRSIQGTRPEVGVTIIIRIRGGPCGGITTPRGRFPRCFFNRSFPRFNEPSRPQRKSKPQARAIQNTPNTLYLIAPQSMGRTPDELTAGYETVGSKPLCCQADGTGQRAFSFGNWQIDFQPRQMATDPDCKIRTRDLDGGPL